MSNWLMMVTTMMSLLLYSCGDNIPIFTNSCDVLAPTEDIPWLKEAIESVGLDEYSVYNMASYKGETVFYYINCNPLINYASIVKNCNGEDLGFTNNLIDDLENEVTIWEHKNSRCN